MTTRELIADWFDRGVSKGATHMLVVCDTFDHTDYPVYAMTDEACLKKFDAPGEMQRVMEVYDLRLDKAMQMAETRARHLPARLNPSETSSD